MWTVLLLVLSNIFMTFAWYGHLGWFKGNGHAVWVIILLSWGIALFEYCFMIPANRMGTDKYGFSAAELKTMQEIITLVVFAGFSIFFLKQKLQWNHIAGFLCIIAAGFFVFNPLFKPEESPSPLAQPSDPAYSPPNTVEES